MDWLPVTNFAIDRRFLQRARSAGTVAELKRHLKGDEYFGFAAWYQESLSFYERKSEESCQVALYNVASWSAIQQAILHADIALTVVRDIAWLTKTRYQNRRFVADFPDANSSIIADAIFDHPEFKPFRYASRIIKIMAHQFTIQERNDDGGLLLNFIPFKIIEEEPVAIQRSINIQLHVEGNFAVTVI